jgi:Mg2+ and Co2+ transporter CorA
MPGVSGEFYTQSHHGRILALMLVQAFKVERQASRKLLQKINAFLEEITIVNHVLKQQVQVLMGLRQSLDPATFKTPSIARKLRYNFECKGIDKIVQTIQEQLRYCEELHKRATLLSEQNVQLVETLQDNINKAVFIFTVVTITFLPMGFVAGYFGMNLAGISGTARQASDFWFIAIPVTFGVLVMGSIVALKGEEVFFAVEGIPRRLKGLLSDRE